MKTKQLLSTFSLTVMLFAACTSGGNNREQNEAAVLDKDNGYKLELISGLNTYQDALLNMMLPYDEDEIDGMVEFVFEAINFKPGEKAKSKNELNLRKNSAGSYINLLLNGESHKQLISTTHNAKLSNGHYVSLAFLCDGYDIAVKNPEAYVARQFLVGDTEQTFIDLSEPMIFYNQPSGVYNSDESIVLDFYVLNSTLKSNGFQVELQIDGQKHIVDSWDNFRITGLGAGAYTAQLTLVDPKGNKVAGKFATASGTFKVLGNDKMLM